MSTNSLFTEDSRSATFDLTTSVALPHNRDAAPLSGLSRRWRRERRRRAVARAYDMAIEIARFIPSGSEVLDVGCGNGYIAHHLSALLATSVMGVDVTDNSRAQIAYQTFDGVTLPAPDESFNAVLFCYVLHHAQDLRGLLLEMRRVLRRGGTAIIYEDDPASAFDRAVCWSHDLQWRSRTGPCTFRSLSTWRTTFESFGFRIELERPLSRWRNLAHPVKRMMLVLRRDY
jgi:SAM-dependent methyltransferase